jgi:hypothetical protein
MDVPPYFVLFADLLGFKRLVLDHKVPFPENLEYKDRPRRFSLGSLASFGNPLSRGFTTFHGGVETTFNNIAWGADVNIIVFSDSLFLATISANDCFLFAEQLLRYCINHDAPMRMGIGRGSFVSYGFGFEEAPKIKFSSSQFFGSGVIYATEAEKQLKGMRIAIHSSAVEALAAEPAIYNEALPQYKLMTVPAPEATPAINYEWNYLGTWQSSESLVWGGKDTDFGTVITLHDHVRTMRDNSPSEPAIRLQYTRTIEAFQRMEQAVKDFVAVRSHTS